MAPSSDPAHTGDKSAHGFIDPVQRANGPDKDELSASGISRYSWHWKTVSWIFGFQLVALLSAIGHFVLFTCLNGSLVDTGRLQQSYISAVSILLVTLFKSSITASIGTCFAQHLWLVLRGDAVSVSLIEKLFTLRNNAVALGNLRVIWKAPLLFLMALFVWCLGIATIYPPGAMTVGPRPYILTKTMEVSVLSPPLIDVDPNVFCAGNFSRLWSAGNTDSTFAGSVRFSYWAPEPVVYNMARAAMMGDRIVSSPTYTGENSTYSLQFRAPQVHCTASNSSWNSKWKPISNANHENILPSLAMKWENNTLLIQKFRLNHAKTFLGPAKNYSDHDALDVVLDIEETSCLGQSLLFDLNITHTEGAQQISDRISDPQPMDDISIEPPLSFYKDDTTRKRRENSPLPIRVDDPQDWNDWVAHASSTMNQLTLLDSLGWWMTDSTNQSCYPWIGECTTYYDTNAYCAATCGPSANQSYRLAGSVFHTTRDHLTRRQKFTGGGKMTYKYDVLEDIHPSEELINELLYNMTISALSLGGGRDKVPVTTTVYRNTYQFSHRRNLVLPYSICLGIAVMFALIAMWSLRQNGIPAADGGFLQIMMATRGDTEMERLVLKEGLMATDNVSKELEQLNVRYGRLIGQEERMGFGTVDETLGPRKRKSKLSREE